jgi:hypothetical protein
MTGLADVLRRLEAAERDAASIVSGLDDEVLNRAPAPGAWSVAQCLDHLRVSSEVYVPARRRALPRAGTR